MLTYLALGDSYTIGEGVPLHHSYPTQFVQLLRRDGLDISGAEILARTGWTTDELQHEVDGYHFSEKYSIVSLLIGVNNEYRKRTAENFKIEFEALLKKAISLCTSDSSGVYVLSIPDYSFTPFAEKLNKDQISSRIDEFNAVCRSVSSRHGVHHLDITDFTREIGADELFLATDKLHYSAKTYLHWAKMLRNKFAGNENP